MVENPDLDEFFMEEPVGSEWAGYLPHGDHVVLGGNAEEDAWDLDPDPSTAEGILAAVPESSRGSAARGSSSIASACARSVPPCGWRASGSAARAACTATATAGRASACRGAAPARPSGCSTARPPDARPGYGTASLPVTVPGARRRRGSFAAGS